jgi:hypothetical protein
MYDSRNKSDAEFADDVRVPAQHNRVGALLFDSLVTKAMEKHEEGAYTTTNRLVDLLRRLETIDLGLGIPNAIGILAKELESREKEVILEVVEPELKVLQQQDPGYDATTIFSQIVEAFQEVEPFRFFGVNSRNFSSSRKLSSPELLS